MKLLKYSIGLGLLVILFYQAPVEKLFSLLLAVDSIAFVIGFLLTFLAILLSISKLHYILNFSSSVSFSLVFKSYYLGIFFNNFIPTSIGGDLVKIKALNRKEELTTLRNSSAVFLERASGILALGFIALFVTVFDPELYLKMGAGLLLDGFTWFAIAIGAAVLVGLWRWLSSYSESDEKESTLSKLIDSLNEPFENPGLGAVVLALSFLFHAIRAVMFSILGSSIGLDIYFVETLALLPIIAFISFLPISFGGIGLREGIITFCLTGLGFPFESSFAVALLYRVYTFIHSLSGAIIYLAGEDFIFQN